MIRDSTYSRAETCLLIGYAELMLMWLAATNNDGWLFDDAQQYSGFWLDRAVRLSLVEG